VRHDVLRIVSVVAEEFLRAFGLRQRETEFLGRRDDFGGGFFDGGVALDGDRLRGGVDALGDDGDVGG